MVDLVNHPVKPGRNFLVITGRGGADIPLQLRGIGDAVDLVPTFNHGDAVLNLAEVGVNGSISEQAAFGFDELYQSSDGVDSLGWHRAVGRLASAGNLVVEAAGVGEDNVPAGGLADNQGTEFVRRALAG